MREKIIAGNWKMYTTIQDGLALTESLLAELASSSLEGVRVILIPPFTHIYTLAAALAGSDRVNVGAQNCYFHKEGAFTGEVSTTMLRQAGARYVIIGHSERRQFFHETNDLLSHKVTAVLREDMQPIYCCGETLEERESGKYFEVVKTQIQGGLFHLKMEEMQKVIIAYEPVWAIGTGKTAGPDQAQEIHAFIRSVIEEKYGEAISDRIPILYGGSVKPGNARELFAQKDIDGGLVGGASLVAADFAAIIHAA